MDEHALKVLEFGSIKEILKEDASSSLGAEVLERTEPLQDRDRIVKLLQETTELRTFLQCHQEFSLWGLSNVRPILEQIKPSGVLLQAYQLLQIRDFLSGLSRVRSFLTDEEDEFPLLAARARGLVPLPSVVGAIRRCISESGDVEDHASSRLHGLRKSAREVRAHTISALEEILRDKPSLAQEAIVTLRNDRYVIPLRPDFRRHIQGIVHDRSSSGATVFVEPEVVVPLNDRLLRLRREEEREVYRILRRLTETVREKRETIWRNADLMAELDALAAKARYSIRFGCVEPVIRAEPCVQLRQARHPLLLRRKHEGFLAAGEQTGLVVPIDVEVGRRFQTLLITGPNTGGKTVALKTLGLLCTMALAGMHIPAGDGSEVGVFREILADIGDEQSIEQNLSTFSSHMVQVRNALEKADARSLVLLDEVGAGTEPSEGAALGIAILEALHARGARVVATTHHNAIKVYACQQEGMANASVEFDTQTLSPRYTLTIGVPGRSKALEIAGRLGLPEPILRRAREELLEEHRQVEGVLEQLEADLKRAREERAALSQEREAVQQIKEEYLRLRADVRTQRNALKRAFTREVREFLAGARKEIGETITAIRSHRDGVEDAVRSMARLEKDADDMLRPERVASPLLAREIHEGQRVRIESLGVEGVVVSLSRSQGMVGVAVGKRRFEVPVEELGQPRQGAVAAEPHKMSGDYHVVLQETDTAGESTIRVIGETVEEALSKVDKEIDAAFVRRIPQVRVIHGGGMGRLRRAIADMLDNHPHVKTYALAQPREGGRGVTVVTLDV